MKVSNDPWFITDGIAELLCELFCLKTFHHTIETMEKHGQREARDFLHFVGKFYDSQASIRKFLKEQEEV